MVARRTWTIHRGRKSSPWRRQKARAVCYKNRVFAKDLVATVQSWIPERFQKPLPGSAPGVLEIRLRQRSGGIDTHYAGWNGDEQVSSDSLGGLTRFASIATSEPEAEFIVAKINSLDLSPVMKWSESAGLEKHLEQRAGQVPDLRINVTIEYVPDLDNLTVELAVGNRDLKESPDLTVKIDFEDIEDMQTGNLTAMQLLGRLRFVGDASSLLQLMPR